MTFPTSGPNHLEVVIREGGKRELQVADKRLVFEVVSKRWYDKLFEALPFLARGRFVPVKVQNNAKPIYVKISSLTSQLGITKEKVEQLTKEGRLEKSIQAFNPSAHKRANEILEELRKGEVNVPPQLEEAIRQTLQIQFSLPRDKAPKEFTYKIIPVGKNTDHWMLIEDGPSLREPKVFLLEGKKLGQGSFARVIEGTELSTTASAGPGPVFKILNLENEINHLPSLEEKIQRLESKLEKSPDNNQETKNELERLIKHRKNILDFIKRAKFELANEAAALKRLYHGEEALIGIQPLSHLKRTTNYQSEQGVLQGERFDVDLFAAATLELTPEEHFLAAYQLTEGLATAHEEGVYHRDIKMENVGCYLSKATQEGRSWIRVFHSDWGSAAWRAKEGVKSNIQGSEGLFIKGEKQEAARLGREIKAVDKKIDSLSHLSEVLRLGASSSMPEICQAIAKVLAQVDNPEKTEPLVLKEKLLEAQVSESAVELILKVLHPLSESALTPSIEEIYQALFNFKDFEGISSEQVLEGLKMKLICQCLRGADIDNFVKDSKSPNPTEQPLIEQIYRAFEVTDDAQLTSELSKRIEHLKSAQAELQEEQDALHEKIDVFALCMSLFEFITKTSLVEFVKKKQFLIYPDSQKTFEQRLGSAKMATKLSSKAKKLIIAGLDTNHARRPRTAEIRNALRAEIPYPDFDDIPVMSEDEAQRELEQSKDSVNYVLRRDRQFPNAYFIVIKKPDGTYQQVQENVTTKTSKIGFMIGDMLNRNQVAWGLTLPELVVEE